MRKLVGLAVLVFLVWFFFIRPGSTEFGCEASGAVAHASSGECPPSLAGAAGSAGWAADRLVAIADRPATVGLAYDEDGVETEFTSGEDDDSELVNDVLRLEGVDFPPAKTHPSSSHVETKVAARMRDEELSAVVLVINNQDGVCTGSYGCQGVLEAILPPGSTLVVWSPSTIDAGVPNRFVGRAS